MDSSGQTGFAADRRFLASAAYPHWIAVVGVGLLCLFQYAAGLTVPWISGRLAGALIDPRSLVPETVNLLFAALILVLVIQSGLGFGAHWLVTTIQTRLESSLRSRIYDHLQALPLSFFHARRLGDVLALLVRDAGQVANFVSGALGTAVPHVLTFTAAWILMIRIDLAAGIAAGLVVPLFIAATKIMMRRMRPLSTTLAESHDRMLAHAESHLDAILLLKAFDRAADSAKSYARKSSDIAVLEKRVAIALGRIQPVLSLISGIAVVGLLWVLTRKVGTGSLGIGELVTFLMYGYFLAKPMGSLAVIYGQFQHTRASAARIQQVLDESVEDPGGRRIVERVRGDVSLRDIRFSYPGRPAALNGCSLEIRAGQTVAIVGPNGAGKSTIAHLLLRFADVESGHIEIDGHPIRAIELSSLRSNMGLVSQRVLLLDGTVAENIRFGRTSADEGEVVAAADAAQAHEFILNLPDGYYTRIGEHGIRLSGGQRQRIALARALLKDPPILILDEATAHFDPDAELRFLNAAANSLQERTVILITHHAAALAIADRIVRMENGRVVRDETNVPPVLPLRRFA